MGVLIISLLMGILAIVGVISVTVYGILVFASCMWTLIGAGLYFRFGLFKFFYHDVLHWHTPGKSPQRYDGCSIHATCKYCGKDIMQDSQGNWF